MSAPQQFAQRPKSIFNDFKYDMPKSTAPVQGAKFPATWTWELGTTGKIFFKVNDGIWGKDDPNAKNKEVELECFHRDALLEVIERAARDENFKGKQVTIKKQLFNPQTNRPNETPSVIATFTVAKDSKGVIKVNYARGSYEVMFNLITDKLEIKGKDESGQVVVDYGLSSGVYAISFVNFSRKFLGEYEWTNYKRPEPKNKPNNQQYGNNNNQQNNTPSTESFDDLEF